MTRISEEVATASDKVKTQSDTVIAVAENERHAVEQTTTDPAAASETMKQIAQLAQECNATAETTIKTTQAALQAVTSTVSGINSTRDTIRETEKRIKRLGERSQEISGVVNLINTIAERTPHPGAERQHACGLGWRGGPRLRGRGRRSAAAGAKRP